MSVGPWLSLNTVEGAEVPLYILQCDASGALTSPLTMQHLQAALASGAFTHVLFMSHGWNNTFEDAVALYEGLFIGMEGHRNTNGLPWPGYRPVVVGLHWPSIALVFGGEAGPLIAGPAVAPDVSDLAERASDPARAAELLTGGPLDPAAVSELAGLLSSLTGGDAAELEALWRKSYPEEPEHGASNWGTVDEPLAAGFLGNLDPRWIYRLATVWQMKDRAREVGFGGAAEILRGLGTATPIHLFGHSYGCQVMLGALCADPAVSVASMLLLQPAVNVYACAKDVPGPQGAGGYRVALDRSDGPIVYTRTKQDGPLYQVFHLAVRRSKDLGEPLPAGAAPKFGAIGGYGMQGMAAGEVVRVKLTAGMTLPTGSHEVLELNGDAVIEGHGDIQRAEVYNVAVQQVAP